MTSRVKRPRPRRKDEMHEKRQDILLDWTNGKLNDSHFNSFIVRISQISGEKNHKPFTDKETAFVCDVQNM